MLCPRGLCREYKLCTPPPRPEDHNKEKYSMKTYNIFEID
jgi:hypothetical protein